MAGLRDVTAHGYFTLKMSDIWIFAETELQILANDINSLLDASDNTRRNDDDSVKRK